MELPVQLEDDPALTQTDSATRLLARGRNILNVLEHQAQAAKLAAQVLQLRAAIEQAEQGDASQLDQWLQQLEHATTLSGETTRAQVTVASTTATWVREPAHDALRGPHMAGDESLPPAGWTAYLPHAQQRLAAYADETWPWDDLCQDRDPISGEIGHQLPSNKLLDKSIEHFGVEVGVEVSNEQPEQAEQPAAPESTDFDPALAQALELSAVTGQEPATKHPKRFWGSLSFSLIGHAILFLALGTITYHHQDAAASLGAQVLQAVEVSEEVPELGSELEMAELEAPAAAEELVSTDAPASTSAISELTPSISAASLSDAVSAPSAASSIASAVGKGGASSGSGGASGGGLGRGGGGQMGGKFFGAGTGGNYFYYVVDSSGSMRGQAWESAKQELLRSLMTLKPTQQFYIVFFDFEMHAIPEPGTRQPATHGLLATKENIDHARRWMETVKLARGGPPTQALAWAIQRQPDAIYLLTDGVTKVDVCGYVREINLIDDLISGPQVRVPIHPIAYHSLDGQQLMRQLADENKGQFHYVPKP